MTENEARLALHNDFQSWKGLWGVFRGWFQPGLCRAPAVRAGTQGTRARLEWVTLLFLPGLSILASSRLVYHFSILSLFYHLSISYLASSLWIPDSLVVRSQCEVTFKETAVSQKKNVIQSNSNIHLASKEKAKQKEYILNVHQDIFKIHYSESLPFSIPSTEMAAASWNLTLHPSLEARPKPLHNIQPVWLTLQPSLPSLAQFSIMYLNLTSLAFLVGVSDFFPHGSYRKAETLVQVWILLLYEAKKMEKDWILIECYFFLVAWRSHRGGKSFLKGCHWFSPF